MKKLFILLGVILIFNLYAQEKKDEKTYTQKEFDEKLKVELDKAVERLKKKSITQLTKEILKKEQEVLKKEKEFEQRHEQLKIGEETLAKRIIDFENDKKKILGCIEENEKNESMRINQLVEMISGMKPLKAAEILSVQESEISVKIIEKIDPVKASKIFNVMDKEVSARLQKQYLNMKQ